jgi:hypothetical protein
MLSGAAGRTARLTRYNDGFLTQRGTFQKYFEQAELKGLLENALAQEAIAISPGIFVVFREVPSEPPSARSGYFAPSIAP